MKWFFLLLLSANVGLLVWSVQQHKDVEPELTQEAGVGNLRLVTQREQAIAPVPASPDAVLGEPEPALPEPEIANANDGEPAGSQESDDFAQSDIETSTAEPFAAPEPVPDQPALLGDAPILQPQQLIAFDVDQRRARRKIARVGKNAPMAVWPYLPEGGYGSLLLDDDLGNEEPESQQAVAEAGLVNDTLREEASGKVALADSPPTETANLPDMSSSEDGHDAVHAPLIESPLPAVAEEPATVPAEQHQLTALSDPVPPEPVVEKTVEVCGVLGPIEDDAMARSLVSGLQGKGVGASLRQELQQKVKGYWVIVPPLKNRRAAIAMEQKLIANGVSDVMRFYKGKMRNGVSLGMYSRKRNAEKRMRRIAAKGFNVEVRARTKQIPVHMIDYRAEETLNEQALRGVQEKYPNLEHSSQTCPQIVSS